MKGRKKRVRYTILKKIFKQSHAWSMCLHLPSPISCVNNTEAATWPYGSKCPHLTARRSHQSQRWECECEWLSISLWMDGLKLMYVWMDGQMNGRIQMYWIKMDGWMDGITLICWEWSFSVANNKDISLKRETMQVRKRGKETDFFPLSVAPMPPGAAINKPPPLSIRNYSHSKKYPLRQVGRCTSCLWTFLGVFIVLTLVLPQTYFTLSPYNISRIAHVD